MRIGFYIKYNKNSINSRGNVVGEELYVESLCKSLCKFSSISSAEVFAPNCLPQDKMDIMVYVNDTAPKSRWAKKSVLYLQNSYSHLTAGRLIKKFQSLNYDGYIFFSELMLKIHNSLGYKGIFLPFGVDLSLFYPRQPDPRYAYEVAYVGNNIKGTERTTKYLFPAARYNFGLFGSWGCQHRFRFWKNKKSQYRETFKKISQGKISQNQEATLYSNAIINLNFTSQACVDWDTVTDRIYKVLACRGFLITDMVAAAQSQMKDCLIFTQGGDDLISKIDYYLKHERERREIAQRGYDYVIKNASIDIRAEKLVEYLESLHGNGA